MGQGASLAIRIEGKSTFKAALWGFFRAKPLGAIGGAVLLFMVAVALLAPLVAPDPLRTDFLARFSPPSATHLFGADELGRDVFSRLVYGARVSLFVGLVATILGTAAGALLGVVSAYVGGRLDMLLQRGMDVLMAFPVLILALVIMAVLGQSMTNVIAAIAIPFAPRANRILRSAALAVKEFQYIEAARAAGCKPWRIVLWHIGPNCFAPYMVIATALLGNAITVEAGLAFLGLGVPPPAPSWGRSLSEGMSFMREAPWLVLFPGIALSLGVFGINLLGDALRDTLDPKLRAR